MKNIWIVISIFVSVFFSAFPPSNTSAANLSYTYDNLNRLTMVEIVDSVPPTVQNTTPTAGVTLVSVTTTITATFNEPLDPASITAAIFTLQNGGTTVSGNSAYDPNTNTLTFTPSASLAYDTIYTTTIAAGVRDLAGNATTDVYTWSFRSALPPPGSISGKVTNSSGVGIAGVLVDPVDAVSGSYLSGVITQSDGSYTIVGLPAASYKLQFQGPSGYLTQWYNNKASSTLADAVAVTAGATTSGINVTLIMGGTITGKVTNSSGTGIANVSVYVSDAVSGSSYSGATTQSDGNYTIKGLPTDSYKLQFQGTSGYLTQWYNNKASSTLADAVAVTAGATTSGINATLLMGGTITGKVTNSSGTGIVDVMVYASDASGGSGYGYGFSQPDGSYTITGLPTGSYKLEFQDYNSVYLTQWYNNKTSSTLADSVAVTAGSTTSGINATLLMGGTITGRVTNSSGTGISGVWVYASDAAGGSYNSYGCNTQSDGNYTIKGLPTGSYKLQFSPYGTEYSAQWYNNKTSITLADSVAVTAGSSISGINAVLALGGKIAGRVVDNNGTAIEGISVAAYDINDEYVTSSFTDLNGDYLLIGLNSGKYKIFFGDYNRGYGYINKYFNNTLDIEKSTLIQVTAPNTISDINATLELGGRISGTVTNENGSGLQWVYVDVFDSSGNAVSYAFTDEQGNYQVIGLPIGTVKIHFFGGYNSFSGQWYSNKGQFSSADTVSVTSLENVPNINAVLGTGPEIYPYPVVVNYGKYSINTTTFRTINIYNSGNVALTLGDIGLSGPNAADFSYQDDLCSGQVIFPGGSCTFKTIFNPTTVSVKSATISIPSNDPDTAVLNIALSGSGTPDVAVLNTIILGTGTGSIHSSPDTGISCIKGISDGCSKTFAFGTLVTLTASPDFTSSVFGGWSNACNLEPCEITMDADKTAEATFTLAPMSKLDLGAVSGYDTLPGAYINAATTIYSLSGLFSGDWLLDKGKDITLIGGYLADYGPIRNGFTILNGKLSIQSGSLRVNGVKIRP